MALAPKTAGAAVMVVFARAFARKGEEEGGQSAKERYYAATNGPPCSEIPEGHSMPCLPGWKVSAARPAEVLN